jgi:hypothetical protein
LADPRPRTCYKCHSPKEKGKRCLPCRSEYLAKRHAENAAAREQIKRWGENRRSRNQCLCSGNQVLKSRTRCARCLDNHRDLYYQKVYGITLAEYNAMLLAQGGVCAICEDAPEKKRLAVDHDHETGELRGLLCFGCNIAIGHLKESKDMLERTLAYMNRVKKIQVVRGIA